MEDKSSNKSSSMNFIPTSLIKSCSTVFSEIISNFANLSISQGSFPLFFKLAQVTPLLKKPGLDKNTPSNYLPISNLNNISKLLERFILSRIQYHTISSCNFNPFQSAYRRYYSTESALLLALDNIYHAIDEGLSMVLILLDFSTPFDTIDHTILLSRLQTSFGISGLDLAWFHSYLEGRSQFVRIGCSTSPVTLYTTGVPQESVLGPMFFLYSSHPLQILSVHVAFCSRNTLTTLSSMSPYPKIITILQLPNLSFVSRHSIPGSSIALNPDKSEAIVFGATHRSRSLPIISTVNVAGTLVQVYNQVRIVGGTLDSRLSFDAHISAFSKSCFYHLHHFTTSVPTSH